jgi:dipeptidyl aminopeptidase/acylaminoacyl peptidase
MLETIETPKAYLKKYPHKLPASDWTQGIVGFYGFYDFTSTKGFTEFGLEFTLRQYWGAYHKQISQETLAEMSPLSWVDGNEPAFLLIHGTEDNAVKNWMSEETASALKKAGVETELLLVEANHSFIHHNHLLDPVNIQTLEVIDAFLSTQLLK